MGVRHQFGTIHAVQALTESQENQTSSFERIERSMAEDRPPKLSGSTFATRARMRNTNVCSKT